MILLRVVLVAVMFFAPLAAPAANAVTISGNWLTQEIFTGQSDNGFRVLNPPSECAGGYFYIDVSTDGGKALLSTLVTAHITRLPVTWIVYHLDQPTGKCWVDLLQFPIPPS